MNSTGASDMRRTPPDVIAWMALLARFMSDLVQLRGVTEYRSVPAVELQLDFDVFGQPHRNHVGGLFHHGLKLHWHPLSDTGPTECQDPLDE